MADKNQSSSSENDQPFRLPWPENSLMQRRMNRYVAEWEKQKDDAANMNKDEITKNENTLVSQNNTKKDKQQ